MHLFLNEISNWWKLRICKDFCQFSTNTDTFIWYIFFTDDKGAAYLTLCQNLARKAALAPSAAVRKYPKGGIPYEYSNHAVNKGDVIKKRINSKTSHEKECRSAGQSEARSNQSEAQELVIDEEVRSTRVRPTRVKARRGVELFCLMENNELDWYDFDEVDVDPSEVPGQLSALHGIPVIRIEEKDSRHMDGQWKFAKHYITFVF